MRSLQLIEFGAPLEWRELETPEPRGSEVLLETVATGVCHSDLHLWEGFYELGGGKRSYVKDRGVKLPVTLGHEIVGRVAATGSEVKGISPGELHLVYPWIGCDQCATCAAGDSHVCSSPRSIGIFTAGGFADHVLVPDFRSLVPIGDLPPEVAASYACAGLTAYSALRKLPPLGEEDQLVIIGAGGLGLMAAQLVRSVTPARVTLVDIDDQKLEAARRLGDFGTVNSSGGDARREVLRGGSPAGAAAVIDFVGSSATAALGFSLLAKNGVLILVGLFGGELTIPTPSLPLKNVTLRGSYTGSLAELRNLVELIRAGDLPRVPIECMPMDQVQGALERISDGKLVGRAVVSPL
jgi:alcohol dehydrogenase, propanol-preferring